MDSEQIRKARGDLGFTQAEMVTALGVDDRVYRKWESGERKISKGSQTAIELLVFIRWHNPVMLLEWIAEQEAQKENGNN